MLRNLHSVKITKNRRKEGIPGHLLAFKVNVQRNLSIWKWQMGFKILSYLLDTKFIFENMFSRKLVKKTLWKYSITNTCIFMKECKNKQTIQILEVCHIFSWKTLPHMARQTFFIMRSISSEDGYSASLITNSG